MVIERKNIGLYEENGRFSGCIIHIFIYVVLKATTFSSQFCFFNTLRHYEFRTPTSLILIETALKRVSPSQFQSKIKFQSVNSKNPKNAHFLYLSYFCLLYLSTRHSILRAHIRIHPLQQHQRLQVVFIYSTDVSYSQTLQNSSVHNFSWSK